MISDQTLREIDQLTKIADKYANLLIDYGGTLYSGINIDTRSKTFNFSVGPTTHGLSRRVVLPLDIIDRENDLLDLANDQKRRWKEEHEKNTCKMCGQTKLISYIDI